MAGAPTPAPIPPAAFYGDHRGSARWEKTRAKIKRVVKRSSFPGFKRFWKLDLASAYADGVTSSSSSNASANSKSSSTSNSKSRAAKKDLRIFAEEKNKSGARQFLVMTYDEFWYEYSRLPRESKIFYEVIRTGHPCRLYFDLEFEYAHNTGIDEPQLMERFIDRLIAQIKSKLDIEITRKNIIDLNATSHKKFSHHLIVHFPNAVFENTFSMGVFVNELCQNIECEELEYEAKMDKDADSALGTDVASSASTTGDQGAPPKMRQSLLINVPDSRKKALFARQRRLDLQRSTSEGSSNYASAARSSDLFARSNTAPVDALARETSTKPAANQDHIAHKENSSTDSNRVDSSDMKVETLPEPAEKQQQKSPDAAAAAAAAATTGAATAAAPPAVAAAATPTTAVEEEQFLTRKTFVDRAVYTSNRCFRLMKSSKIDQNRPLVLAPNCQFPHEREQDLFYASLICNVKVDESTRVISCGAPPPGGLTRMFGHGAVVAQGMMNRPGFMQPAYLGPGDDNSELLLPPHLRAGNSAGVGAGAGVGFGAEFSRHGEGGSPYPKIDRFIQGIVTSRGKPGYIRSWSHMKTERHEFLKYDIYGHRYCHNIGRHHKGNHVYLVVDLNEGVYRQRCWDREDCDGYESPPFRIPWSVYQTPENLELERALEGLVTPQKGETTSISANATASCPNSTSAPSSSQSGLRGGDTVHPSADDMNFSFDWSTPLSFIRRHDDVSSEPPTSINSSGHHNRRISSSHFPDPVADDAPSKPCSNYPQQVSPMNLSATADADADSFDPDADDHNMFYDFATPTSSHRRGRGAPQSDTPARRAMGTSSSDSPITLFSPHIRFSTASTEASTTYSPRHRRTPAAASEQKPVGDSDDLNASFALKTPRSVRRRRVAATPRATSSQSDTPRATSSQLDTPRATFFQPCQSVTPRTIASSQPDTPRATSSQSDTSRATSFSFSQPETSRTIASSQLNITRATSFSQPDTPRATSSQPDTPRATSSSSQLNTPRATFSQPDAQKVTSSQLTSSLSDAPTATPSQLNEVIQSSDDDFNASLDFGAAHVPLRRRRKVATRGRSPFHGLATRGSSPFHSATTPDRSTSRGVATPGPSLSQVVPTPSTCSSLRLATPTPSPSYSVATPSSSPSQGLATAGSSASQNFATPTPSPSYSLTTPSSSPSQGLATAGSSSSQNYATPTPSPSYSVARPSSSPSQGLATAGSSASQNFATPTPSPSCSVATPSSSPSQGLATAGSSSSQNFATPTPSPSYSVATPSSSPSQGLATAGSSASHNLATSGRSLSRRVASRRREHATPRADGLLDVSSDFPTPRPLQRRRVVRASPDTPIVPETPPIAHKHFLPRSSAAPLSQMYSQVPESPLETSHISHHTPDSGGGSAPMDMSSLSQASESPIHRHTPQSGPLADSVSMELESSQPMELDSSQPMAAGGSSGTLAAEDRSRRFSEYYVSAEDLDGLVF